MERLNKLNTIGGYANGRYVKSFRAYEAAEFTKEFFEADYTIHFTFRK
jgi:hypothetical protein